MRKLARAVGLTNPKLFKQLKDLSTNEQIDKLSNLFDEHHISYTSKDLTQKAISKCQHDYQIQKELKDLNSSHKGQQHSDVVENSESTGRPKRKTRKEINYADVLKQDALDAMLAKEDREVRGVNTDDKPTPSKANNKSKTKRKKIKRVTAKQKQKQKQKKMVVTMKN